MKCKWCRNQFQPDTWPDFCSESCLDRWLERQESYWTPERRQRLYKKFDRWLAQQEKELEARVNASSASIRLSREYC